MRTLTAYRPSQRHPLSLEARYRDLAGMATCYCEIDPDAPVVATKRGNRRVDGTQHQALHEPRCPHSELVITAFALTSGAKRRARRIAVEMWKRRHGRH